MRNKIVKNYFLYGMIEMIESITVQSTDVSSLLLVRRLMYIYLYIITGIFLYKILMNIFLTKHVRSLKKWPQEHTFFVRKGLLNC